MFHPRGPSFRELAEQALSSTERGYDLLATKFDFTPFRTPDPVIAQVAARIGHPVEVSLDLCTGTGAALPFLARVSRRVIGFDFSAGMLAEAARRAAALEGAPPIELVRGNVLELPFESEIDAITCFGAFGHIERRDEPRFVAGIARALVPGGRFLFATTELPPLWSRARLLSHGFNAAMRVRNALIRPPFVMYYLTFTWPGCAQLLERHGFRVRAEPSGLEPPLDRVLVVVATKAGPRADAR